MCAAPGATLSISLSRETIRLMMQSQRMIKKEFGVRIELDDDQVMARVFAYAAQSRCGELKQCASELMQQLLPGASSDNDEKPGSKPGSAARIYRGQVLPARAATEDRESRSADASSSRPAKNVIYRGRRVSC